MAASIKRAIRKTLMEIIEGKNTSTPATPAERLEACRLLWKDLASAQKGKPRGRPFRKQSKFTLKSPAERLAELVESAPH